MHKSGPDFLLLLLLLLLSLLSLLLLLLLFLIFIIIIIWTSFQTKVDWINRVLYNKKRNGGVGLANLVCAGVCLSSKLLFGINRNS